MSAEYGINFPQVDGGGRSSTPTGKSILASSVAGLDAELAGRIGAVKNWRTEYPRHFEDVVRVEAGSAQAAIDVARAGLASATSLFVDVGADGDHPAEHCLQTPGELRTVPIQGTDAPVRELTVPYHGDVLRGAALLRQLDAWVAAGITEPSFADAVGAVVRNPDWLDLRDRTFALVGAASRLSMAFDILFQELAGGRHDLSVCYLATPADVFLVPVRAVDMAERRHDGAERLATVGRVVHQVSLGRYFRPNYPADAVIETPTNRYGLVNAFILEQGQNYALAKRLQRWRMVLTRQDGILTSVHIAPPARTQSVLKNPLMRERQAINTHLGIETFDPPTVDVLSAAILVHDLSNPASPANPANPIGHLHEAFMFAASPGGRWRVPFELNSCIPCSARCRGPRSRPSTPDSAWPPSEGRPSCACYAGESQVQPGTLRSTQKQPTRTRVSRKRQPDGFTRTGGRPRRRQTRLSTASSTRPGRTAGLRSSDVATSPCSSACIDRRPPHPGQYVPVRA